MKSVHILGVRVANVTEQEALEFILSGLEKRDKKLAIFTPNPEIIMHADKDEAFRKILNSADLALPDGIGVILAGKILGKDFRQRIAGADFVEELCREAAKRALTVGLMGGGTKIAERAAECLWRKYPKLKIVYVGSEWSEGGFVRNSIDILFVALGFPKQEKWIYDNLPKIPVRAAMAVGGSFDYISGVVPRAPLFVRKLGLEWLVRLLVQPWRIRRQLALVEFIFLVLKERFLKINR